MAAREAGLHVAAPRGLMQKSLRDMKGNPRRPHTSLKHRDKEKFGVVATRLGGRTSAKDRCISQVIMNSNPASSGRRGLPGPHGPCSTPTNSVRPRVHPVLDPSKLGTLIVRG